MRFHSRGKKAFKSSRKKEKKESGKTIFVLCLNINSVVATPLMFVFFPFLLLSSLSFFCHISSRCLFYHFILKQGVENLVQNFQFFSGFLNYFFFVFLIQKTFLIKYFLIFKSLPPLAGHKLLLSF
jgi:hypothetical protein